MVLFKIKVSGRNIKETALRNYFIKVTARPSFTRLRVKPYLGNEEQKLLFLVTSQSDVHIDFDFARPFFRVPDRGAN